tara:strand:- start:3046 stop:3570 length:525 start_codon:yes stop_codon:yes gene_type:complete
MILDTINNLNNKFIKFLKYFASFALIILGLLILFDVVMRAFINKPVIGVAEVISNSIVIIAFFQISYTISIDAMIKSEFLLKKANYNFSCLLEVFSSLLGIIFFGLIAYASFEPTINSWIRNEFEGHASFRFPTFPVKISIFICSIFAAFTYFLRMLIFILNIRENKPSQIRIK